MSTHALSAAQVMTRLDGFDAVIDVRSPSEFAQDHLPGAVNWPVLDDKERVLIGTEYKQVSAFEAKKRGAALVAKNIAAHIELNVIHQSKSWRPLVYCWRGGQRSASMAWFLAQMGFHTHVLADGYKAFRSAVMTELETLPGRLKFNVVCGKTGSGKTRLLQALREAGAQVLDLEALASHRGSVLGVLPGRPQPTQKAFETALWNEFRHIDATKAVFVESESKKIGNLRVPEALIQHMRTHGQCLHVEMPDGGRLALILEDYDFLVRDRDLLCTLLDCLLALRGCETIEGWKAAARAGQVSKVFLELMHQHYDPGYLKSMRTNFSGFDQARTLALPDGSPSTLQRAASELMSSVNAC
jgi:tRNA 2-selenouridine synthase